MGYFAGARDLRNLVAVAAKLRQLAQGPVVRADRRLYLTAAAALEARAARMAENLPEDSHDREVEIALHRPVDLIV